MDENCTQWCYAAPATGRMPQSGKEISMDTAALSLLGVVPTVGARVELTWTVSDAENAYEKTDTFTLVGWWEYDEISPVHYINVSEEYVRNAQTEATAAGMGMFHTDLNVMLSSAVNILGQMEQIDTDLGYTWDTPGAENNVRIGENWGYTSSRISDMDMETVLALAAFIILIVFTGYLIIYNVFQISVTGDIRFTAY